MLMHRKRHHQIWQFIYETLWTCTQAPDQPTLIVPVLELLLLEVDGEVVEVDGEVVLADGELVVVVEVVGDVVVPVLVSLVTPRAVVTVDGDVEVDEDPVLPVSKESVPWMPAVFPVPASSSKSPAASTLFLLIRPFHEFQYTEFPYRAEFPLNMELAMLPTPL